MNMEWRIDWGDRFGEFQGSCQPEFNWTVIWKFEGDCLNQSQLIIQRKLVHTLLLHFQPYFPSKASSLSGQSDELNRGIRKCRILEFHQAWMQDRSDSSDLELMKNDKTRDYIFLIDQISYVLLLIASIRQFQ